jgi:hypothetical protein
MIAKILMVVSAGTPGVVIHRRSSLGGMLNYYYHEAAA